MGLYGNYMISIFWDTIDPNTLLVRKPGFEIFSAALAVH